MAKKAKDETLKKIIIEVIKADFPDIEIKAILGYEVDNEEDIVLGQLASGRNIVYHFMFTRENPMVSLQRYM